MKNSRPGGAEGELEPCWVRKASPAKAPTPAHYILRPVGAGSSDPQSTGSAVGLRPTRSTRGYNPPPLRGTIQAGTIK